MRKRKKKDKRKRRKGEKENLCAEVDDVLGGLGQVHFLLRYFWQIIHNNVCM
jgi:hypothetical protein